ncbi:uncharacterized protein EV422DRAFT_162812 [Fimicolochytrium jonesii]|uniref:uncharacterized protein n=1 Tax=Fimicolochytrium jonesii TaxID=1396493 RepID=UPI0022FECEEF|nr:uncharacterized protein EV422DRAFT_162812 [Fimicolochytrium jonesii]KAI8818719.1 hypothetical protein EV422DRAFT_162812 [Fimicolochytrium jonesii]
MSPVVEDVRGKRIRVFRNGDMYDAGKRLVINPRVYRNYEQFLSRITAEINLVTGAARRVYTLDGQPLHTLDDIKDGSIYVATSGEHLKRIPYLITTDPTLAAISSSNIRGGPGRASGVGVRDRGLSVAASDVDEDERAATEAAQRPAYLRASYSRKRPSAWGAGAVNQRFGTSRVVKAADEGKQAEKERPLFGPTSKAYRVTVFVNGEATTPGTSLVLNYRNCKTYEQLLRNLTDNLQISVRKLYDAETGHRISSLRQLHEHQNIVASVSDGFKPVAYLIEHFNRGKDPRGEDEVRS